jgi:hypothetical protein
LQDFSRGCKNDDLKNLIDFPSEVLSHSAIKQKITTPSVLLEKQIPNGIRVEGGMQ